MTGKIWRNLFPGEWTASFQIIPIGCKRFYIGLHLQKPDEFFMENGAEERNNDR
jgi:hypothetical protein